MDTMVTAIKFILAVAILVLEIIPESCTNLIQCLSVVNGNEIMLFSPLPCNKLNHRNKILCPIPAAIFSSGKEFGREG